MNKKQAEAIAKKMVRKGKKKKGASAYAGRYSLAAYNGGEPFTEHATKKVLLAFWLEVVNSPHYTVLEKMYCEDKLLETL